MTDSHSFNVIAFGAKRDDKSDDTRAIQKALDAAAQLQGTVFLPAGSYRCGELRVASGVTIMGQASWSYRNSRGTVLRLNDSPAKCILNLTGSYGATVTGLCLVGKGNETAAKVHGIMFDNEKFGPEEDAPCIDHCRVERFSGDGIWLGRVWCFTVWHSQFFCNGGCGLHLRGWDGFVLDNWFSGNEGAGFGAYDENASVTMTGNRIEWNRKGGIVSMGGNHYNITGNYIDRSGRNGIALLPREGQRWESSTFAVTGNVIYRSGKPEWGTDDEYDSAQVRFEGVAGVVFSGNAMRAGTDDGGKGNPSPDYGIVIRSLENSIIKDNVMHHGALKELVIDRGEHRGQMIVKDNIGSLLEKGKS